MIVRVMDFRLKNWKYKTVYKRNTFEIWWSQNYLSCINQSKALTSAHPVLIIFSMTSRACTSIVISATILSRWILVKLPRMASENFPSIEICFLRRPLSGFLSCLSLVEERALVQSDVHWIWQDVMSSWKKVFKIW